ncbi:MAG: hypothetical protein M0P74_10725 [Syntrophales bacterium]|jgi:hypothetical protein|nr:hypothetical protein [Syntrophales bacterium]
MQEILLLIVIALALFYIPRLRAGKTATREAAKPSVLTGWMRLAILVTILWLAGLAAFIEPWDKNLLLYLYAGIAPAFIFWGGVWVFFGYKKYRC